MYQSRSSNQNTWQQYCINETRFEDCFEKVDKNWGYETGIKGFYDIHGNYFNGGYDPNYVCGDSPKHTQPVFWEDAQGVVCR